MIVSALPTLTLVTRMDCSNALLNLYASENDSQERECDQRDGHDAEEHAYDEYCLFHAESPKFPEVLCGPVC